MVHQVATESGGRLAALLVWIHMLTGDGIEPAAHQAETLRAADLHHFHDPRRRTSKALAAGLGAGRGVVWDTYLLFGPEAQWVESPPAPDDWSHQLDAAWADPARRRRYDDLLAWLRDALA